MKRALAAIALVGVGVVGTLTTLYALTFLYEKESGMPSYRHFIAKFEE